ncbi:MAG TPA: hypothetical protein P5218_16540, partial [Planctomycetota bacterium]|nr:hypothetical protein [Planctomycetota bacterium]
SMLQVTHALCVWGARNAEAAAVLAKAPPWVQRSHVAGGDLTAENDGADCAAWVPLRNRRSLSRPHRGGYLGGHESV